MTGFALLDVAIGVIFAVLTFSLIATAMQEVLAAVFNWRGRMLRRGLFRLLESAADGKALVEASFFRPNWWGGDRAISKANLSMEVMNSPLMRSLQGARSYFFSFGSNKAEKARIAAEEARAELQRIQARYVREIAEARKQFSGDGLAARLAELASSRNRDLEQLRKVKGDAEDLLASIGRMPARIPKETFAAALLDALYQKVRLELNERLFAALSEAEETAKTRRQEVLKAVTAAREKAEAARDKANGAPGDFPLEAFADDALIIAKGALAPDLVYAETFAKVMGRHVDEAFEDVIDLIERLPMSDQLKIRVRGAVRDLAVSRVIAERIDSFAQGMDGLENAIRAQVGALDARIETVLAEISAWFDASMDRVTGWYIRRAKYVTAAIGFAMALIVNFDVIGYGHQLLKDEALRKRIVAQAEAAVVAENVGGLAVARKTDAIFAVLRLNRDRDGIEAGRISADEVRKGWPTLTTAQRRALLTDGNNPGDVPPSSLNQSQIAAVVSAANDVLKTMEGAFPVDSNGDGEVSSAEEREAATAFLSAAQRQYGQGVKILETQFADQGVHMGRECARHPLVLDGADRHNRLVVWLSGWDVTQPVASAYACVAGTLQWQALLSWFLIGLGCSLGAQFWFDVLKNLFKVRAAASGLNSDLKKMMSEGHAGAASGGPGAGQGSGPVG